MEGQSLPETRGALEMGTVAEPDGTRYRGFCYPGSLVRLPTGKLMASFTAQCPPHPFRAMACRSTDNGRTWTSPEVLFGGEGLSAASKDTGEGYADPCLVVAGRGRVIALCVSLLYEAGRGGYSLARTRFWRRISLDGGETFGPVEEMPRHHRYIVGTIHPGLRLRDGTLLLPYSWDRSAEQNRPAEGEGGMDLVSGVLTSRDGGATWTAGGDLHPEVPRASNALPSAVSGLDEPAVVELPDGDLFLLARTGSNRLWQSFSHDGGRTWERAQPSPLVSHNCPAALLRLAQDDAILVVYNNHPEQRACLSVSLSADGCRSWTEPKVIAPIGHPDRPEASYPAVCQLDDGTLLTIFGQIDHSDPGSLFSVRSVRFDRSFLA